MIAYNADAASRLIEQARKQYARCGAVSTADALDMADQLEALARDFATLRASVVAALSSAGPEVAEDEHTA